MSWIDQLIRHLEQVTCSGCGEYYHGGDIAAVVTEQLKRLGEAQYSSQDLRVQLSVSQHVQLPRVSKNNTSSGHSSSKMREG